jgi:hypothetical protein
VLKLSNLFNFASLRTFAIAKLFPITNSFDKIILARDYGMDEWLEDAYLDVCMAGTLPSDDDSEALGFPTFRKVARAWEILGIGQSSKPHETSLYRRAIIADIFSVTRFKEHSFNALDPESKNENEQGAEKTNALDAIQPVGEANDPQNVVHKATPTAPTACGDSGEDVVAGRATQESRHRGDTGKGEEKVEHKQRVEEDKQRAPKDAKLRAREKRQQGKLRRRAEHAEIKRQFEEEESMYDAEMEREEEIRCREEEDEIRRREEEEEEIRLLEEEEENSRFEEEEETRRCYEEIMRELFRREEETRKAQELYRQAEEEEKRRAQENRKRAENAERKRLARAGEAEHRAAEKVQGQQAKKKNNTNDHPRQPSVATGTSPDIYGSVRAERVNTLSSRGHGPWPFGHGFKLAPILVHKVDSSEESLSGGDVYYS